MDYCSPMGNDLIEQWYLDQSEEAQAAFDSTLKTLSIERDWRALKEFKMLGRQYPGLGEIRFTVGNVQYRPAGSFGPGERTSTLWVGCYKKQGIYYPPNAFDLAMDRRRLYKNKGRGSLRERFI